MPARLKFKSHLFPHNPSALKLSEKRPVQQYLLESGKLLFVEDAPMQRVLSGEGEFVGPLAQEQFEALRAVYRSPGAGELQAPGFGSFRAVFLELSGELRAGGEGILYRFQFLEAPEQP